MYQAIDSYGAIDSDSSQIFFVSAIHSTEDSFFNVHLLPQPGSVVGITISSPGHGCTSSGSLSASGGGGSGFVGSFQILNGSISETEIIDGGYDFTSPPIINISSGGHGCQEWALIPKISLPGEYYGTFITTTSGIYRVRPVLLQRKGLYASFYNNSYFLGAPFMYRIDESISYHGENSLLLSVGLSVTSASWEGALHIDGGIPRPTAGLGRSISSIHVLQRGSGCISSGMLTSQGGGGAGLLASFSVVTYYDSKNNVANGIGKIMILNPGVGYSTVPHIVLVSNGTGCTDYRLLATLTTSSAGMTTFYIETDGYAY